MFLLLMLLSLSFFFLRRFYWRLFLEKPCLFGFLFSFLFVGLLLAGVNESALAQNESCEKVLHSANDSDKPSIEAALPPRSTPALASSPPFGPFDYSHLIHKLNRVIGSEKNPFETDPLDLKAISLSHKKMAQILPLYDRVYELKHEGKDLSPKEFEEIYQELEKRVNSLLLYSSKFKKFGLREILRVIQILETQVRQPLPETSFAETLLNPLAPSDNQLEHPQEESTNIPFDWMPPPDKYTPENTNMEFQASSKDALIILRTDVITEKRLYPLKYYDIINEKGFFSTPVSRPFAKIKPVNSPQNPPHWIHLKRPLLRKVIESFPVPEGYRPVLGSYDHFTVMEDVPDQYKIILSQQRHVSSSEEISLGIEPINKLEAMGPLGLSLYQQKTGLDLELWPSRLKEKIKQIKNQHTSPLAIAAAVEAFLSGDEYLYYSVGDILTPIEFKKLETQYHQLLSHYPKALAMAHLQAFKCDGAAWIAAALLRDFFGIPVRIVGGLTADHGLLEFQGKPHEVIRAESPGHAWIEVWSQDKNRWVSFDPTPRRNNPQIPSSQEDKKRSPRPPIPSSLDPFVSPPAPPITPPASEEESKSTKTKTPRPVQRDFEVRRLQESKLSRSLNDLLLETFYSHYARKGLWEGLSSFARGEFDRQLHDFIQHFEFMMNHHKQENQNYYLKKMDRFQNLAESSHKDLMTRLRQAGANISAGQMREAWKELKSLQLQIEELQSSERTFTPSELEFFKQLNFVLHEFDLIKHNKSESYELGVHLLENLPGTISQSLLKKRYPLLDKPGSLDSLALAESLTKSGESDLIALAMAHPYTHLFLHSEKVPHYQEVKSFDRSFDPAKPRDIIRTRRLTDFPRMILQPKPGESIFADTVRGEQLAIGYNETHRANNPRSVTDKKVSLLYYDVSDSMLFNPLRLRAQDALIMAFVDSALTEVDALGRPTHKVFLIPFDDAIGTALEISTREEALRLIEEQHIPHLTNGSGNTAIEPVLLDFYDKILFAHDKSQTQRSKSLSKLKKANLVLFSDGVSSVSFETVRERQEEVAELTGLRLHLNFVAIEHENPTLKRLATQFQTTESRSSYYHIDSAQLESFQTGQAFRALPSETFAFDESQLPPPALMQAFELLRLKSVFPHQDFDFQSLQKKLEPWKTPVIPPENQTDELDSAVLALKDILGYVTKNEHVPRELKFALIETAVRGYLQQCQESARVLSPVEIQILEELVRLMMTR